MSQHFNLVIHLDNLIHNQAANNVLKAPQELGETQNTNMLPAQIRNNHREEEGRSCLHATTAMIPP